jgi:hypothetical protein
LRGGDNNNFFSGTERLPDSRSAPPATRSAGGSRPAAELRGRLRAVRGKHRGRPPARDGDDQPRPVRHRRLAHLLARPAQRDHAVTLNGGLRQYLYAGGDAAQYVLESSPQFVQRIGRDATYNLNYSYLRPYGGAPLNFRLDSIGSNNNLGTSLNVQSYRTRLSL